jgi:hypothetical protein
MKMCMLIVYVATALCLKAPNIGELVTLNVTKRWLLSLSSPRDGYYRYQACSCSSDHPLHCYS